MQGLNPIVRQHIRLFRARLDPMGHFTHGTGLRYACLLTTADPGSHREPRQGMGLCSLAGCSHRVGDAILDREQND
jgi:hypothetical protein